MNRFIQTSTTNQKTGKVEIEVTQYLEVEMAECFPAHERELLDAGKVVERTSKHYGKMTVVDLVSFYAANAKMEA